MLQAKRLGGFAALNLGLIEDCYSKIAVRAPALARSGGFCGENRGSLRRCAAQGRVTRGLERSGFTAVQKGAAEDCFWLRGGKENEADWADWHLSREGAALRREHLEGWDLEQVWHLLEEGGDAPLRLHRAPAPEGDYARVVEIGDRAALLDFARAVNSGEARPDTLYRLTADIDLGGRAWTPVGTDQEQPFQGCFDGGGHRISHFVVRAGKHHLAGFFGCVGRRGRVEGLSVDCVILGHGTYAAPLCAVNEGTLADCTATARCDLSHYTGGLVAQNSGAVRRCAALGRLGKGVPVPWWAAALLLLLLCFPLPAYFALTAQAAGQEIFAPVIIDPNARPIDPEEEVMPEPEEPDDTSASFIMNAEMYVSSENYAGTIGLRCPTWSTRGFVATARLTEEDQLRAGYTGGGTVVLYQSGLIAPGYGVDVITLSALPDGRKLPPGEYELSVLLEFYDVQTNEKSAVNTVIPLEVTVG